MPASGKLRAVPCGARTNKWCALVIPYGGRSSSLADSCPKGLRPVVNAAQACWQNVAEAGPGCARVSFQASAFSKSAQSKSWAGLSTSAFIGTADPSQRYNKHIHNFAESLCALVV